LADRAIARLDDAELFHQLATRPGLIPIHIDLEQEQLVWCDIGEHRLTEAFFGTFVARIAQEPDDRWFFVTGLDVLTLDYGFLDLLPPAGFVFHMARCGSTLLSRALARSPQHVVLSEAQPHNAIWWCWTGRWREGLRWTDKRLKAYRNLLLLTGRRRCAEQRAFFVKFSSWNVLLRSLIQQAFPDVPGVFLYRDPGEVMVSCLGEKPGWLLTKGSGFAAFAVAASAEATAAMTDLTFCERYLGRLLTSALAGPSCDLAYLGYHDLTLDNLGAILEAAFDVTAPQDQITLMHEQFRRYSKDDDDVTPFVRDTETKRDAVTPEIRASVEGTLRRGYEALEASERNLRPAFPRTPAGTIRAPEAPARRGRRSRRARQGSRGAGC
jgi:hypothetical protein